MKINKIVVATMLCGAIATTASAKVNYNFLGKMYGGVQYGILNLDEESTNALDFNFGVVKQTEKYVFGVDLQYEMPADSTYPSFLNMELKVGYRFISKANVYGLISYDFISNSFTDNLTGGGVGFGVGAKYQLIDYVAATFKAKHTSLSYITGSSFSKDTATIGLEFNFCTSDGNQKWQK